MPTMIARIEAWERGCDGSGECIAPEHAGGSEDYKRRGRTADALAEIQTLATYSGAYPPRVGRLEREALSGRDARCARPWTTTEQLANAALTRFCS